MEQDINKKRIGLLFKILDKYGIYYRLSCDDCGIKEMGKVNCPEKEKCSHRNLRVVIKTKELFKSEYFRNNPDRLRKEK